MKTPGWQAMSWILLFVAGCSGAGGNDDGGILDGLDGGDQVLNPLRIGSADTLEIATWNIRNFPENQITGERVAFLIGEMDLDLVAVQEITDQQAFMQMLGGMDSYEGVLSTDEYGPGNYQKTGLIYRKDMIDVSGQQALFEGDTYAFPRPPLKVDVSVSLPGGGTLTFIAIVVHLKADVGAENEARRRDACEKLKAHIDGIVAQGDETEVVVMGDFNDAIDDWPDYNVFNVFLDAAEDYRFLTTDLADAGEYTLIPWTNLVDHLLITKDLEDDYQGGNTQVVHLDELLGDYDYVDEVSDHRPVVSVFGQ
jgi:uncharacterized protein